MEKFIHIKIHIGKNQASWKLCTKIIGLVDKKIGWLTKKIGLGEKGVPLNSG